MDKQEIKQISI